MKSIVKSSLGNYYVRAIPGFKRYKRSYIENEMNYYPFSDDSVENYGSKEENIQNCISKDNSMDKVEGFTLLCNIY